MYYRVYIVSCRLLLPAKEGPQVKIRPSKSTADGCLCKIREKQTACAENCGNILFIPSNIKCKKNKYMCDNPFTMETRLFAACRRRPFNIFTSCQNPTLQQNCISFETDNGILMSPELYNLLNMCNLVFCMTGSPISKCVGLAPP